MFCAAKSTKRLLAILSSIIAYFASAKEEQELEERMTKNVVKRFFDDEISAPTSSRLFNPFRVFPIYIYLFSAPLPRFLPFTSSSSKNAKHSPVLHTKTLHRMLLPRIIFK